MTDVMNLKTRFILIQTVYDAIAPYPVGAETVEFTGQFGAGRRLGQQPIDGGSNKTLDFRRQFRNEARRLGRVTS